MQRRRFNNVLSFPERMTQEAERLRAEAEQARGEQREKLLRQARHADTAVHLNEWLCSPGLRQPE